MYHPLAAMPALLPPIPVPLSLTPTLPSPRVAGETSSLNHGDKTLQSDSFHSEEKPCTNYNKKQTEPAATKVVKSAPISPSIGPPSKNEGPPTPTGGPPISVGRKGSSSSSNVSSPPKKARILNNNNNNKKMGGGPPHGYPPGRRGSPHTPPADLHQSPSKFSYHPRNNRTFYSSGYDQGPPQMGWGYRSGVPMGGMRPSYNRFGGHHHSQQGPMDGKRRRPQH